MTTETTMALCLLTELVCALREGDADGFKSWLALGVQDLGSESVVELMVDRVTLVDRGR